MTRHNNIAIALIRSHSFVDLTAECADSKSARGIDASLALGHVVPSVVVAILDQLMLAVEDGDLGLSGGLDEGVQVFDGVGGVDAGLEERVEFAVGVEELVERVDEEDACFLLHFVLLSPLSSLLLSERCCHKWNL